jgi:hypothetical protein
MSENSIPKCFCIVCSKPLDVQRQADGKNGFFYLLTCWDKTCGMYSVTRSLESYGKLSPADIQAYCEMNGKSWAVQHG